MYEFLGKLKFLFFVGLVVAATIYAIGQGLIAIWQYVVVAICGIGGAYIAAKIFDARNPFPEEALKHFPMRLEVIEKERTGGFNYKRHKLDLIIHPKISPRDWAAIKRMGLEKRVLFNAPNIALDDGTTYPFKIADLERNTAIAFNDKIQLDDAKEALLRGMQNLKGHIESREDAPKKEIFEI